MSLDPAACALACCRWPQPCRAAGRGADRYALIVAGATRRAGIRHAIRRVDARSGEVARRAHEVRAGAGHGPDRDAPSPTAAATAANVRRALTSIRDRMTRDDLLFIVLIGHGTFDGVDAKFNLVGPDLESADWAALLRPLPGRVVVVNTSSAQLSVPRAAGGPRRGSSSPRPIRPRSGSTPCFPEYFIRALDRRRPRTSTRTAASRSGRRSPRPAATCGATTSSAASSRPSARCSTTTATASAGRSAIPATTGRSRAARYLDESLPGAAPTDEVLLKLLQRRATLEADVEDLKIRKTFLPPAEYAKEFERIMIELAKVSHDIRARAKS